MLIFIIIFVSSITQSSDKPSSSFEIDSIPISNNISVLIRLVCFENDSLIIASNTYGSDAILVNRNSCGANDVVSYDFIFAKKLKKDSSGIIRKLAIEGHTVSIYSAKGKAPAIVRTDI
ncbi:MAG: hypothetical protein CBC09_05400 [Cellvibrionales bacterium TMED49]|nr:hypothetical protein [Porticoccaceae bacterium]OUU38429.1 MAG: hypothetical protein CBC09_05400 [Cellvibrionales bacterium TMED49]